MLRTYNILNSYLISHDLKTLFKSSGEKDITLREAAGCNSLIDRLDY